MKLRSYILSGIIYFHLFNLTNACDFQLELNTPSPVSVPLEEQHYKGIINHVYKTDMGLFKNSSNASTPSLITLKLKSVKNIEDTIRRTSLQIIDTCMVPSSQPIAKKAKVEEDKSLGEPSTSVGRITFSFPHQDVTQPQEKISLHNKDSKISPKKRKAQQMCSPDESFAVVGKVVLLENPLELNYKGKFHLDLLYIYDSYQGKGLGTKALNSLKKVIQELSYSSSFYQTLTLLSQDVDYKGKELASVPTRVKFYMNNQFSLNEKTKDLICFLDIKHFINRFDLPQFTDYITTYILPESLVPHASNIAKDILPVIQASPKFTPIPFETLVHYVQTNCNPCSVHILDRAFYWGNGITDEEQEHFDKYLYLMSYTHNSTNDVQPIASVHPGGKSAAEFLQEQTKWKDFSLLADQNNLNDEIDALIKGWATSNLAS